MVIKIVALELLREVFHNGSRSWLIKIKKSGLRKQRQSLNVSVFGNISVPMSQWIQKRTESVFKLLIFNISSSPLIEQIKRKLSEKSRMRWALLTKRFLKFPQKDKKLEGKESLTYLSLCKGQKGIQQQFAWLQGQHVSWGAPAYFAQLSQLQVDLSHPSMVVKPNGTNAETIISHKY